MNISGFLDQLLKSAQSMAGEATTRAGGLSERLENEGIGGFKLGKLAQGALAGSALTLLLGNRSGRRLATLGGLAALGVMAYRAMQQSGGATSASEPQTLDRLQAPEQVEAHGRVVLVALIAAAKSDGHIDARERGLIHEEVARLGDPALTAWLDAELAKPLHAADVAAAATTREMASEMYLASLLIADEQNAGERAYLDELAQRLSLGGELKAALERQVR